MKDRWDGKDLDLKMKGRGFIPRVINAFIFVKQQKLMVRIMRRCPDWVTPNRVTVFRMLLTAPAIWLIAVHGWWWALVLTLSAAFLDFVDGWLAEAKGMKTRLGAILDPLADKLFVIGICLTLALTAPLVWYWRVATTAVVLTELAIGAFRLLALKKKEKTAQEIIVAEWSGKLKMVIESLGIITITLGLALSSAPAVTVGGILLASSIPFGLLSLLTKIAR